MDERIDDRMDDRRQARERELVADDAGDAGHAHADDTVPQADIASANPGVSSVAGTAGGGYGTGSGSGSSGGSAGGGDNASAGPATDFVRGASGSEVSGSDETAGPHPDPDEQRDRGRDAARTSLPPDVAGE